MAAGGSFKQQCPSCDAMVLIKDRKLIGKKIDCTLCNFVSVVQPPAGEESEEEPKEAAKPAAKPSAKGVPAAAAKKPAPTKPGAPAARRRSVHANRSTTTTRSRKSNRRRKAATTRCSSGLGLPCFAWCSWRSAATSSCRTIPIPTAKSRQEPGGSPPSRPLLPTSRPEVKDSGEVPTNLLPNDTQVVLNVLVNGPVGNSATETPGAFSPKQLERKLGLKPNEVEGLLVGLNLDGKKHWAFAVVRHPGQKVHRRGGPQDRPESSAGAGRRDQGQGILRHAAESLARQPGADDPVLAAAVRRSRCRAGAAFAGHLHPESHRPHRGRPGPAEGLPRSRRRTKLLSPRPCHRQERRGGPRPLSDHRADPEAGPGPRRGQIGQGAAASAWPGT